MQRVLKSNLLAIVPPYSTWIPPLGSARLLGHLRRAGCDDFDFVDLRLWTSDCYAPTYETVGTYGETFVVDVPDLPLVLRLLRAFDRGERCTWTPDPAMEAYALDRGIHFAYLSRYLNQLDTFLHASIERLPSVDFIGLSTWSSNFLPTLIAAQHLKRRRPSTFVVLGGPAVSLSRASARLALRSGLANAIVVGEGEQSFLELYRAYQEGADIRDIPGVLTSDPAGGEATYSERPLMRLDELALPDFSGMPIMSYQTHGYPLTILPFEISRGCTDKCTFCSEWVLWRKYRQAQTSPVVEQLEALVRMHGAQGFWFRDSLMNGVARRFEQFCETLLSKRLDVKWMGYARADFTPESAKLARRAGLETTYVGIESLDDRTLELMNKRRTASDNVHALRALLDAGIRVRAGFIPGFPGATREAVRQTAGVLGRLQQEYRGQLTVNAEPFTPYAGQPILAELDRYGLEAHSWAPSVIEIAPRYADITTEIVERVSGASQGLERMGMQREVVVIASGGEGGEAEAGDVFVTRGATEDLHDRKLSFDDLGRGVWLASYKSSRGVRQALLYSDEEKREYERVSRLQPADTTAHAQTIAERHLAAAADSASRVADLPTSLGPATPESEPLVLSPFAVAREIGSRLMIVDRFSKHRARLALDWGPLVAALAAAPHAREDLRALAPQDAIATDQLLSLLAARGLVLTLSPRAPAHRPALRVIHPRTKGETA